MHDQLLNRNVTSKTQVRSSSGSSKLIHSWAPSGASPAAAAAAVAPAAPVVRPAPATSSDTRPTDSFRGAELDQQLAGGQQSLPELRHHHPFVGCVVAVV